MASEEHPDIVFGKVDTEVEQALAVTFRVSSIPAPLAFRDGWCSPGALPPSAVAQVVQTVRDLGMAEVRAALAAQSGTA